MQLGLECVKRTQAFFRGPLPPCRTVVTNRLDIPLRDPTLASLGWCGVRSLHLGIPGQTAGDKANHPASRYCPDFDFHCAITLCEAFSKGHIYHDRTAAVRLSTLLSQVLSGCRCGALSVPPPRAIAPD
jgi:hypothetical protein